MDSQLEAILPALSHCFQLSFFSICGNFLSMAIMDKTPWHASVLSSLCQELYPVPWEGFSSLGILQPRRFAQCRAELLEILKDLGRPRTIWISSSPCPHCGKNTFSHPEPITNAATPLPRWKNQKLSSEHLETEIYDTGTLWREKRSMFSDICSMWMWKEKVILWGAKLQREYLMLSSDGTLCTCVLQSKNYKPKFLKVDSSLWPTCWSYPWLDGCKEIIRNKEMLSVNQLLPSMYHLFFPLTLRCRNLQMQIFKNSVSETTIFTHSLFCLRHISRVCSDSCPLSQWHYLAISSSSTTFSFSLQPFPASESFFQ